jgi:hypothetical protein
MVGCSLRCQWNDPSLDCICDQKNPVTFGKISRQKTTPKELEPVQLRHKFRFSKLYIDPFDAVAV